WNAAVAGDRITYQQQYKYGLQLMDFFLDILEHEVLIKKQAPDVFQKIVDYTKKLCIHHGNHDFWTGIKFIPMFTRVELLEVLVFIVEDSPRLQEADYDPIYDDVIFNPQFEPMLTQKNPKTGDIITESHNTFYEGVTLKDLEGFKDQNPNNSTVVKQYGRIVEKIWRAGNSNATSGLYAKELSAVVSHLNAALPYADPAQLKSLKFLIQYFEEGTTKLYDDYNITWLHANPVADLILGFIEEYRDARGMKGLYEAFIYYRNAPATQMITKLSSIAQELEHHAPWNDAYKNRTIKPPVANAVVELIGTGGAGPCGFVGVNLPNAQWIREKHGSKNIIITNALLASRSAMIDVVIKEFIEHSQDQELLLDPFWEREILKVALHEIVGHGSGKSSATLNGDPKDHLREHYSTMEEARAELCMLWHVWDPILVEKGIITDTQIPQSAYLWYALRDLINLRRYAAETEIHEDHDRATHLIVSYLQEKGVIEFYSSDGKTYPRIIDYAKMREHVGVLLAELQRIKSEGDYSALQLIVERYATCFDLKLRDEIVMRSHAINYFVTIAYIMAIPELVKNNSGEIVDVTLTYPKDIIEQARVWRSM
ncbi:MAG: hypothetical protein WC916_07560, partial [Candidatus Woesearchaeota archaeon]